MVKICEKKKSLFEFKGDIRNFFSVSYYEKKMSNTLLINILHGLF